MNKAASNGQIRSLASLLDRAKAPDCFAPTHWQVLERRAGTFVLGDGCVFAASNDGRVGSPLAFKDSWRAVYLPIGSDRVLVAAPCEIVNALSDEEINTASVELSADVYFASHATERQASYVPKIGTGVALLSKGEMTRIAQDSWRDIKEGRTGKSS
jgi:hypothetical protein